jgi:hypothetical protein
MAIAPVTKERPSSTADVEALFRAHWPGGVDDVIVTRWDRAVAATWLLLFGAGCAFLLAVAVSVVLDATGVAF